MPEKIQRIPVSLLDALGIKSVGRNPDNMLDEVRGVVDLMPMYESVLIDIEAASSALTGIGDTAQIPVPPGEAWDLVSAQGGVSGGTLTSVTSGARFGVGVFVANSFIRLGTHITTQIVANTERSDGAFMLPKRVILPPGAVIQTRFDATSGGTLTDGSVTVGALFYRLRI